MPAELPDTAPDSAPTERSQPLAARRRLTSSFLAGFAGGILGGIVLALLIAAGTAASWPRLRARMLGGTEVRYDDLDKRVTALAARPTPPPAPSQPAASTPPDTGTAGAIGNLSSRVQALETRASAADPVAIGALSARVDSLGDQVNGLRQNMPTQDSIAALGAKVDQAVKAAQDLATRRQSEVALLLVLGQLRDAVERGDPYTVQLNAVTELAPASEKPYLTALGANAANGVTRRELLAAQYGAAADAAMAASLAAPADATVWQRIEKQAATLISVRRTDGEGTGAAAILGRAQTDLAKGDLPGAVDEAGHLTGAPAQALADWHNRAAARVATDRALSALESDLGAKLASDAPAK